MSSTTGNNLTRELYPTPALVLDSLLAHLKLKPYDIFLEPYRGTDAIFDKIPLTTNQKKWAELSLGIDYLTTDFNKLM